MFTHSSLNGFTMDEIRPQQQPFPIPALREQFGDRPLPEITRKITACVACRKQKIRCQMGGMVRRAFDVGSVDYHAQSIKVCR